ncbi:MAG: SDR family oxidoreductase [Sphaerochaeta sp.]|jgi:NAD(P)-dependent dehydrogenase (short-subunit alcohol dehydrogenase family)|nr:SDR family oxidoreductase [Spirochaetales bacterium]
MFKERVVVITGASYGIGKAIAEAFGQHGATVCSIDIKEGSDFVGDVGLQADLDHFIATIIAKHSTIDYLIHNAPPIMEGIDRCSYERFQYALAVGASAPFYLAQRLRPFFSEDAAMVNITSTRSEMSQPNSESYAAAKGALSALTHALAISLGPTVTVNAIAPGWIDTTNSEFFGPDAQQHPTGRVGVPSDIVSMVLYLCSSAARFITAQEFVIDGGMSRQMIYHGDNGWSFNATK